MPPRRSRPSSRSGASLCGLSRGQNPDDVDLLAAAFGARHSGNCPVARMAYPTVNRQSSRQAAFSPGHGAYIEFPASALSPAIPSGHLYVCVRQARRRGRAADTANMSVSMRSARSSAFIGGAIVPMPASLAPSYTDCRFRHPRQPIACSLNERQYRRLLASVRRGPRGPAAMAYGRPSKLQSLRPPRWAAGSRPSGRPETGSCRPFAYIHALIERNEGAADGGA